MTSPITVTITRHATPERAEEMVAWMQAGTQLASGFGGFLGAGWVRPSAKSEEWHVLYRFDDADTLAAWEASRQRAWWLGAGQPFVEERRVERRTGIEGWFDPPHTYDVEEVSGVPAAPPAWKQAIVIFILFFPISLTVNWLLAHLLPGWTMPERALVGSVVLIPFMTYVGLPWITARMEWFLQGRPPPWRRQQ